MTEDVTASAPVAAPETAAPVSEPAQVSQSEDFDESIIPEDKREDFKKYRERQSAKQKEYEEKLNSETREKFETQARLRQLEQQFRPVEDGEVGAEPDYKDFSTIEEYRDALKSWNKKYAIAEYRQQQTQTQTQQQQMVEAAKLAAKGQAAMQKYPDFQRTVQPLVPVVDQIPVLKAFVNESELGADVIYQLCKNPPLLEGLMKMSPFAAGKELLRIEAALSTPPSKAVTKAPEPIKSVGSGDGSVKSMLEQVKGDNVTDFVNRENRKRLRALRGE